IDAIIGALGLGDIGKHFPDTDIKWKDASSIQLLSQTVDLVRKNGFEITWIDSIVIAEKPKLAPFIDQMKEGIARAGILLSLINIKAKTNEGMGFTGSGEGIAAQAVCLLNPKSQISNNKQ
ncbi:MAG: 2-C-methyl-D-erythritol 2,4-cyclodiphosphate synthase, partial [Nitrospirae bacterium]|nr:2-C-methyl-D-erythritol 2,4-cyclodiphosphate synthase [Nitrospirota bacterium]